MKNMKKLVALVTALVMAIAPMTAFANELTQEGDINYTNTTIYKLTLPTKEGMAFTLDPQGLTSLLVSGGSYDVSAAGLIVSEGPMTAKNQSSVDVKLDAKFYLVDSADATGSAFVASVTDQAQKQIAMTVNVTDVSGNAVGSTINVLGDSDVSASSYTMNKVGYEYTTSASHEFAYTPVDADAATVLNFTIGGNIAKEYDWSAYTGANPKTITLHAVFTFKNAAGTEEVKNTDGTTNGTTNGATDNYVMTKNASGEVFYTFVNAPEGQVTALTIDGASKINAFTNGNITYSDGTFKCNSTVTNNLFTAAGNHTVVVTIGGTEYTLTYTAQ